MAGVIEHERPPRCSTSGADVEHEGVFGTKSGGYQAICPECHKLLWLNNHLADDGVSLDYTFPEHIGKEIT